jgi:hypothetical protein
MTGAFDEINQLPGVLSAALVRCKVRVNAEASGRTWR